MRKKMEALGRQTQAEITEAIAALDGSSFREDTWERPGGGGGWSRVLQDGRVFEKAGVNVSVVHGELSEQAAISMRAKRDLDIGDRRFFATGISLVLHPHNPFCPTVHANFRYFELGDGEARWFGGGADLTPSYVNAEDATHFHQTLKAACDAHDPDYYPRFKAWADDYFHIQHRGERRGVGGIFFDDLEPTPEHSLDARFAFVRTCAGAFLPAYLPIAERRWNTPFTETHRAWQGMRRGRYVEFNLVYDRGTVFGLRTQARIESVLMSLPLHARWEYDPTVVSGSPESETLAVLRRPIDWV
jgi:coproporphyrinogen III oxidase